jgi:hypothetical protein
MFLRSSVCAFYEVNHSLLRGSTVLERILAASQGRFLNLIVKTLGRLIWTSDQPVAIDNTIQRDEDRYPFLDRDSNPRY